MEDIKPIEWSVETVNDLREIMLEKTEKTSEMWFQIESIIANKYDIEV